MARFSPKHFYHWAEPANLPSIRQHGLLSTERLVAMVESSEKKREQILSRHRPDSLVLSNGVIIRDQSPMPPEALAKALRKEMPPSEWYRFLNGFVFLWANEERARRHCGAFGKPQALLVFEASRMLEELGDQIFVCPINSGNARRKPAPRSRESFVRY